MDPSSSCSSPSSSRNWVYDVFPSFSGKDVRQTLLSHLLRELEKKSISAFKDNKMEKSQSLSPVLKLAIRDSRIAVVIFSKNYASSSWCLNELLEIVKCKMKLGQLVIPLFYRMDPSHVRKQTGVFGQLFEKTCHNKAKSMKNRWKKALTYVANLVGHHSVTWDSEAQMIEDIANDVFSKLLTTPSKDFEKCPGIQNHIENMILHLDLDSDEGRIVGVCGSSGIGKTTIARALSNQISSLFQCSAYIDRAIMSKSMEIYSGANPEDHNLKLHLQGIFLSEILGIRGIKAYHLGAVEDRLKNLKVIIFIDDLEHLVVLDTLAGHTNWFGRGSRIIVITKHRHLLTAHGIDHIYDVPFPSDGLSLEMFCQYAFKQSYPPDGFMELATELAMRAGNLPLGLTILGSHLRGRDQKEWMDMLLRFREGLHGKIEELLRFSYEGLNSKNDEAIFRHIAFLSHGGEGNDIKLLLGDSDLDVNSGIQNLVDKSLIHERGNNVEMHSLVQEVGKEIVRGQSNTPGKREFLMDAKDICDVLEDNTGTGTVLGMLFDTDEIEELSIHKEAFKRMSDLRYLKVYNKNLDKKKKVRWHSTGSLDFFPPKLKLLSWENYPMKRLSPNFRPINLIKLQLRESKLEKLWEGVQPLTSLKKMDLCGSRSLKEIPNLSTATVLEELDLSYCSSLMEIPSSVGYLNKLEMLNLSFCENLDTLPVGINLQALDCLDFSGCSQLRSFPCISTNISELRLSETGIEEVPWWIENFTMLRVITMSGCNNLKSVSLYISKLKHLETVNFSNCGALAKVSFNDTPVAEALATNDIHPEDTSSSIPDDYFPRAELDFINCFNLDQEALLHQPSVFSRLILSGEKVPSYFTHRTAGASLTDISLLPTSLSKQFFRFRACAVVHSESNSVGQLSFLIEVHCQFIDRQGKHFGSAHWPLYFTTASLGSHLVIFNCCLPLKGNNAYLARRDYDHVDVQFHLTDDKSEFKIKGSGIRLCEEGESSASNDFGNDTHCSDKETKDVV